MPDYLAMLKKSENRPQGTPKKPNNSDSTKSYYCLGLLGTPPGTLQKKCPDPAPGTESTERGHSAPLAPAANSANRETSGADSVHRAWLVTRPDGAILSVSRCPPAALAEMTADYPGAAVEPLPDPEPMAMHPDDAALAAAYLDHIGELDADIRAEYAAALARWPHRLAGLYSECLRLGLATDGDNAHG